jgi:hypothetical protein
VGLVGRVGEVGRWKSLRKSSNIQKQSPKSRVSEFSSSVSTIL